MPEPTTVDVERCPTHGDDYDFKCDDCRTASLMKDLDEYMIRVGMVRVVEPTTMPSERASRGDENE